MRDFVVKIRNHTAKEFTAPVVKGLPPGSQPLLELEAVRIHRSPPRIRAQGSAQRHRHAARRARHSAVSRSAPGSRAALGRPSAKARSGDADLVVPAAERARYEASFARFASIFPDVFYVSERGRYFPDDSDDKGRLLSAGYHNTMGYFRDDTPLRN